MKRKLDHSGKDGKVDGALERAKLADVRYQLPYMSQSALSALCKWSRDHNGLPELYSRQTIQRARDEYIDINTPYGKLVQECELPYKDGGFMKLEMLNPLAAIYHTLSSSSSIGQVYAKLLETKPQPWHLIVYNDEITPGNQLAHNIAGRLKPSTSPSSSSALCWPASRCGGQPRSPPAKKSQSYEVA